MDRDGKDATNRLSYLILETVGELKLTQPNLSVRYHRGMTREFLDACARVIDRGFGMPAFNNDEVVVPGMLERGVSLEDARDYSAIGCIEVAVPGKWGYRVTGMSFLNMPRILLATLNDGVDATSGKAFFPGTGQSRGLCHLRRAHGPPGAGRSPSTRGRASRWTPRSIRLSKPRCPISSARSSPTTASRAARP